MRNSKRNQLRNNVGIVNRKRIPSWGTLHMYKKVCLIHNKRIHTNNRYTILNNNNIQHNDNNKMYNLCQTLRTWSFIAGQDNPNFECFSPNL